MANESWLDAALRHDNARDSVPGEHWLTGALGAWMLLRGGRGLLGRTAGMAIGAALLARAVSGRDGPLARYRGAGASQALDAVDGRLVRVANGQVVASTADLSALPADGGAAPAYPDDSATEGREATANLARERDPLTP
jgi:hypothetical protein